MYTREEILAYRCPRWNDWPNLDLYMDQAVSLIESNVLLFYADGQPKPVTSTMINNYVKQRIVPPSRKKKYGRDHLAYFYIIFLLKSALNLVDISDVATYFSKQDAQENVFNTFCDEIEAALAAAFGGAPLQTAAAVKGNECIHTIALAFAYTLLARFYIAADQDGSKHKE